MNKVYWDADTNPATAYELGRKDGREAERERIVQIIEDVKTDHWPRESGRGDGYDLDTCDEITRRIIKGAGMSEQLPCSLVVERALTVAGIERKAILSCGEDQHHIYCPAYYQKFIDDAEAALAECEGSPHTSCTRDMSHKAQIELLTQRVAECEAERDAAQNRFVAASELSAARGVEISELREKLDECEQNRIELQTIFDLQWKRMGEATKYWQEKTGNTEIHPDLGDMLHWFIERLSECEREKEMHRKANQGLDASRTNLIHQIENAENRIEGLERKLAAAREALQACYSTMVGRVRPDNPVWNIIAAALTEAGEQPDPHCWRCKERVAYQPEKRFCPHCGATTRLTEAGEGEKHALTDVQNCPVCNPEAGEQEKK